MKRIGIDLGTTNTVGAANGRAIPIDGTGGAALPSVVAFLPNGGVQVGPLARRRRAIDGANTLFSSKRIIGRRFDSTEVRNFRDHYPLALEDQGGWPAFRTRAGQKTPVDVAAHVLEALVARTGIDAKGGAPITVTVPSAFAVPQREATALAADRAGLGEVRLLEEPLATAHAYMASGTRCARAFVYDLGGGTFDCAIVDCTSRAPTVIAHTSDLALGGDDVDQHLAAWVRYLVIEKHNWDLASYVEVYDRLLSECERAKIALSAARRVEFLLGHVDPDCPAADEPIAITRELLDAQCHALLQRSFSACDAVLRQAGMKAGDVDAVLLAGGSTRLGIVQEGVAAYFGKPGALEIDPIEVVAIGASMV